MAKVHYPRVLAGSSVTVGPDETFSSVVWREGLSEPPVPDSRQSGVDFGAIVNGEDQHRTVFEREQYTVLSSPQPKCAARSPCSVLMSPAPVREKRRTTSKIRIAAGAIQLADIGFDLIGPDNAGRWHS